MGRNLSDPPDTINHDIVVQNIANYATIAHDMMIREITTREIMTRETMTHDESTLDIAPVIALPSTPLGMSLIIGMTIMIEGILTVLMQSMSIEEALLLETGVTSLGGTLVGEWITEDLRGTPDRTSMMKEMGRILVVGSKRKSTMAGLKDDKRCATGWIVGLRKV
jgi:hypothetical protein